MSTIAVALRKESVDRNRVLRSPAAPGLVALRKESVDRNREGEQIEREKHTSLSARRAWIEIFLRGSAGRDCTVALRKESVDRNIGRVRTVQQGFLSLSARRAWIEILAFQL